MSSGDTGWLALPLDLGLRGFLSPHISGLTPDPERPWTETSENRAKISLPPYTEHLRDSVTEAESRLTTTGKKMSLHPGKR